MRLWFLRIKEENLTRDEVRKLKMAPVLFKSIPAGNCRLGMAEEEIEQLVEHYYASDSKRTRGQYKGSLRRFLSEAANGDLVGIKINGEQDLLYGEFSSCPLVEVPGHLNLKGRPVRWLHDDEVAILLKNRLTDSVLKYRGTMCLWSEHVDLPEPAEIESEVQAHIVSDGPVIKFIRVGTDGGEGHRLSRLFPGDYYHFIPIPKHNDPEFYRYTYGSGCSAIRDLSLLHLRKDDILVFYAGFRPEAGKDGRPLMDGGDRVGIFAYYTIQEAFLFDYDKKALDGSRGSGLRFSDLSRGVKLLNRELQLTSEFNQLATHQVLDEIVDAYNEVSPHVENSANNSGRAILICGKKKDSRLLCKVEYLASLKNGAYILQPNEARKWGLKENADLTRCSLRTVNHAVAAKVAQQLRNLP